jgi:hypothetical protein
MNADLHGSERSTDHVAYRLGPISRKSRKDIVTGKLVLTDLHRDRSPGPNLRQSAFICG